MGAYEHVTVVADPPPSCAEVAARATEGSALRIQGRSIPLIDSSERAAGLARDMMIIR